MTTNTTNKYSLTYFTIPGRGEAVRMTFHFAGVDFEDKRIESSEWPALKPNVDLIPCGFLPVLTTPCGTKLSQSCAILRYLGNAFNLYGDTNIDRANIDAVIDFNKEIHDNFVSIQFSQDEAQKTTLMATVESQINQAFKYFEVLIKQNKGNDFIAGNKPSIGDIFLMEIVRFMDVILPNNSYMKTYPLIKTLCENTATSSPSLKKYIDTRELRLPQL